MRRLLFALVALALALALVAAASAAALVPLPGNPADRLAAQPLDAAGHDYARRCVGRPQRGTRLLEDWLAEHWAGESWGIVRCERFRGGSVWSLHSEGRALDWRLDARDPAERAAADRLVRLLLAPDRRGHPAALARRMGVQEIIWDCRSWWSGAPGLGRYSACYDAAGRPRRIDRTTAHRDHVHLGLNWRGARGRTSFWRASG
jgi:hypothetical protein